MAEGRKSWDGVALFAGLVTLPTAIFCAAMFGHVDPFAHIGGVRITTYVLFSCVMPLLAVVGGVGALVRGGTGLRVPLVLSTGMLVAATAWIVEDGSAVFAASTAVAALGVGLASAARPR